MPTKMKKQEDGTIRRKKIRIKRNKMKKQKDGMIRKKIKRKGNKNEKQNRKK